MPGTMHFNLFIIDTGHHEASWRLPGSYPLANIDIEYFERLAQLAESVTFDSVFLADSPVLQGDPERRPSGRIEPLTLLTAAARATRRIGLIATASTSYNDPYNLARRFASLDHVSGGRGHRTFAGTPEQIADTIEHWGTHGAADGFNIMPAVLPSGFELFAEHVVPILRRRGLIRHEYEGTTLREHYRLPRPPSQYAAASAATSPAPAGAVT